MSRMRAHNITTLQSLALKKALKLFNDELKTDLHFSAVA